MENRASAPAASASAALARAPRYTSYPTAPHFDEADAPSRQADWLRALPAEPVSLYVHIPFCDTLCWFCACRTQGATKRAPVTRYLGYLEQEIDRVAALVPDGVTIGRMHWGGGSPTVMSPEEMRRLSDLLRSRFRFEEDAEIAVEIDPRDMTEDRLDALRDCGLNRASIGVQDFDETVQRAINRMQGWEMTRDVIEALRARGVTGINVDAIYGLPYQSVESLGRTLEQLIGLAPDRVALYGYAHVPWMARRQKAIPENSLPGAEARLEQAELVRRMLTEAGYDAVGIDHFARPGDGLAVAAREGHLRRNFQGYVDDGCETLIGLGASSISRLPGGFLQNAAATAEYQATIEAGGLAAARGRSLTLDDKVRGHAIEKLMCAFRYDAAEMTRLFGDFARPCQEIASELLSGEEAEWLTPDGAGGFEIRPEARTWTRAVAARFDAYFPTGAARHSRIV
ncbi:oxygen-independent coproporphyrinogen III oxidase [Rhodovulum sp. DZ06]|uniref:oxygen-independent coproporphyrinogen III oxidase n=1 Tax=Rhodovulum sp. DZ06 TaxID=3425126 RepID=UPI003D35125D